MFVRNEGNADAALLALREGGASRTAGRAARSSWRSMARKCVCARALLRGRAQARGAQAVAQPASRRRVVASPSSRRLADSHSAHSSLTHLGSSPASLRFPSRLYRQPIILVAGGTPFLYPQLRGFARGDRRPASSHRLPASPPPRRHVVHGRRRQARPAAARGEPHFARAQPAAQGDGGGALRRFWQVRAHPPNPRGHGARRRRGQGRRGQGRRPARHRLCRVRGYLRRQAGVRPPGWLQCRRAVPHRALLPGGFLFLFSAGSSVGRHGASAFKPFKPPSPINFKTPRLTLRR